MAQSAGAFVAEQSTTIIDFKTRRRLTQAEVVERLDPALQHRPSSLGALQFCACAECQLRSEALLKNDALGQKATSVPRGGYVGRTRRAAAGEFRAMVRAVIEQPLGRGT